MSIKITVRKSKELQVTSVTCPKCFTGEMKFKEGASVKKVFDFECPVCKTMGNPDWFDMMRGSKIGKDNRMRYHTLENKFPPVC